jgi:DNA-binding response OmpR family regulator
MNTSTFEVIIGEKPITLTAKEFEILKLFMQNPKKVFTKTQLFKSIWGGDYINDENTVMVHIRRLREKIEADPSNPKYIQTIWGIGYKLAEE